MKTILSTDGRQFHNIILLQNICGHIKIGFLENSNSNPTHFQTRGPKVQKWLFLLFVHGELIFHLILMGFFVMNS
jgi:hypothetical protein